MLPDPDDEEQEQCDRDYADSLKDCADGDDWDSWTPQEQAEVIAALIMTENA